LRIDNFRITRGYGFLRFRKYKTRRQDKGHHAEVAAFVQRVEHGGEPLIPLAELENATRAAFAAVQSARSDKTIVL
jgi:predicted dehydrogenase